MERTLVLFQSKHGTTEKVAHKLAFAFPDAVHLRKFEKGISINLSIYDNIVIGSSIYMGNISKSLRVFLQSHQMVLTQKKLGLFICYMNDKEAQDELERSFSKELIHHATAIGLFGGEFNFEKLNRLEKFVVRQVSGVKSSISKLDHKAIGEFISKMKRSKVA